MLRLLLIVLSAANSYAMYECGVPHFSIRDKSGGNRVGGWSARPHSIPWQVYLVRRKRNSNHFYTCGGSLIEMDRMNGTDLVLTAAHCLEDDLTYTKSKDIGVVVGAHKLWSKTEKSQRGIKVKMYDHHRYTKDNHANDIVLMKLKERVFYTEYVRPVCLPQKTQEVPVNGKCFVSGWRWLADDGRSTNALQMVNVKIFSKEKCSIPDKLSKLMFCAGYEERAKDSCQGDSGGPLVCEDGGKWVVFGIISHGQGCATRGEPAMYTNVVKYIPWIYEKRRKFFRADRQ